MFENQILNEIYAVASPLVKNYIKQRLAFGYAEEHLAGELGYIIEEVA